MRSLFTYDVTNQLSKSAVRVAQYSENISFSTQFVPKIGIFSRQTALGLQCIGKYRRLNYVNDNMNDDKSVPRFSTVARYGHPADLFFTPRAHVNRVYVRTSSSTCARRVPRAHVEFYVRT